MKEAKGVYGKKTHGQWAGKERAIGTAVCSSVCERDRGFNNERASKTGGTGKLESQGSLLEDGAAKNKKKVTFFWQVVQRLRIYSARPLTSLLVDP